MAVSIDNLLNRIRIGAPLEDTFQPLGATQGAAQNIAQGTTGQRAGGGQFGCPEGQSWNEATNRCEPSVKTPGGGFGNCPKGMVWSEVEIKCVPIDRPVTPETPEIPKPEPPEWFTCPDGTRVQDPSECVEKIGPAPDPTDPTDPTEMRWCAKEGQEIPANQWTISRCSGGDPTPDPDDINDPVNPPVNPIEGEGRDIGDFYDRYPIDYFNKRFGRFGKRPTLEGILEMLGVDLKDKYKKFFGDFEEFPEQMLFRQFDVGKKELRADLFDLTRQSQRLRQQQGLLSGAPREFERLGMGRTGRQFQGLETAFRGDIFQGRLGFEEDTINRLLDLMKSDADPFKKVDPDDPDNKEPGYDGQTWKNKYGDCYEWEDEKNKWSSIRCDDM